MFKIVLKQGFLLNTNPHILFLVFYSIFKTKNIKVQLYLLMPFYFVKTQRFYVQEWLPDWRLKEENKTVMTHIVATKNVIDKCVVHTG